MLDLCLLELARDFGHSVHAHTAKRVGPTKPSAQAWRSDAFGPEVRRIQGAIRHLRHVQGLAATAARRVGRRLRNPCSPDAGDELGRRHPQRAGPHHCQRQRWERRNVRGTSCPSSAMPAGPDQPPVPYAGTEHGLSVGRHLCRDLGGAHLRGVRDRHLRSLDRRLARRLGAKPRRTSIKTTAK